MCGSSAKRSGSIGDAKRRENWKDLAKLFRIFVELASFEPCDGVLTGLRPESVGSHRALPHPPSPVRQGSKSPKRDPMSRISREVVRGGLPDGVESARRWFARFPRARER